MPTDLPFLIVGNVEYRRVQMFAAALRELSQPPPEIIGHRELLQDPARLLCLPDEPRSVRIDSTGESVEVEAALLRLGYGAATTVGVSSVSPAELTATPLRHGEIRCPHQRHLGFLSYLTSLRGSFAQRPSWTLLSPLASIAELFDKRATSRRYADLGLPVPEFIEDELGDPNQLREVLRDRGWRAAFIKLSSASSASCLAIYQPEPNILMTTMRRRPEGWFNSLRVQRVDDPRRVDEVLRFLLREGSQVERAVPKAKLDGAFFDCRILTVAGEPVFTVVRQNSHPITNLHLGGWRGDPEALRTLLPEGTWRSALRSCAVVAEAHGCFQLGVDVMFETDLRNHRILEANAFGDLLPGLERQGHSVYEWEILRVQTWAQSRRNAGPATD